MFSRRESAPQVGPSVVTAFPEAADMSRASRHVFRTIRLPSLTEFGSTTTTSPVVDFLFRPHAAKFLPRAKVSRLYPGVQSGQERASSRASKRMRPIDTHTPGGKTARWTQSCAGILGYAETMRFYFDLNADARAKLRNEASARTASRRNRNAVQSGRSMPGNFEKLHAQQLIRMA